MIQRPSQPAAIRFEDFVKDAVERVVKGHDQPLERGDDFLQHRLRRDVTRHFCGEQILNHRRHQRAAEEVGRQHREDDRHRQRREQASCGAFDERDGHEDDADAEC